MITIRSGRSPALTKRSIQQAETRTAPSATGTTSRIRAALEERKRQGFESLSDSPGSIPAGLGPNVNISGNPVTIDTNPLLTGMTPQLEYSQLIYRLYRDIYYHDAVAGSAVDLLSNLPFSEFTLGSIPDNAKVMNKFMENIERLNARTLLPEASVDYLVTGAHVSSLVYNSEKKVFVDLIPHSIENCSVKSLPFMSQDPVIAVTFPAESRAGLEAGGKRIESLRKLVGQDVLDKIQGGNLELDPLSTLYVSRRTFSDNMLSSRGTSFFKRILPLYLIEKNLYRGTLVESARRQRGIMHLTLGNGEDWEPSISDLEFLTELFMNADSDPLGAIIATREGVMVEEIRQGGDFWKVTDFMDQSMPYKLRALGISEAFLNGDASYNVADQSLTVFVELMRSYREMLTRKIFYNRIFPMISLVNGYTINGKGKLIIKPDLAEQMTPEDAMFTMNDGSRLLIPSISWSKQLKPEGDQAYMDMLNTLSDKGVPVPLRVLAAAGGLNIEDLIKQQDEDLAFRKSVADYLTEVKKLTPAPAEGGGGEYDGEAAASALLRNHGRVPLLSRNFGSDSEVYSIGKTGKKKYVFSQRGANDKINKALAKAMKSASQRGAYDGHTVKPGRVGRSPI